MKTTRLNSFGWEASGIDLGEQVSDKDFARVREMLDNQGLVLFRDQSLDARQQAAFCRRFGKFSGHNQSDREGILGDGSGEPGLRMYFNDNGLGSAPELDFHSDNAHNPFSLTYLTLYGIEFGKDGQPMTGGETMLASAAEALDRLPADLRRRLEGLECRMTAQSMGTHVRPCIEHHWRTGQPYLIPSSLCEAIVGVDPEESARIIEQVRAVLYDPAHLYRHQWRAGDLILWDNRLLHHARAWYDNSQKRTIRRCAIADDAEPTAIAEAEWVG